MSMGRKACSTSLGARLWRRLQRYVGILSYTKVHKVLSASTPEIVILLAYYLGRLARGIVATVTGLVQLLT